MAADVLHEAADEGGFGVDEEGGGVGGEGEGFAAAMDEADADEAVEEDGDSARGGFGFFVDLGGGFGAGVHGVENAELERGFGDQGRGETPDHFHDALRGDGAGFGTGFAFGLFFSG